MGIALFTGREEGPWGLTWLASRAPCRYTTVVHPLIRYRRSEELLLRWMELNAFTTIFRTHEVSNPPATPLACSTGLASSGAGTTWAVWLGFSTQKKPPWLYMADYTLVCGARRRALSLSNRRLSWRYCGRLAWKADLFCPARMMP
jgi:hypothetical protein